MDPDGFHDGGVVGRRRVFEEVVAVTDDSRLRGGFGEGRLLDRLAAAAAAAAVEDELLPGSDGVVGDEVELLPKSVELFLPFSSRIRSLSVESSRK